MSLANENINAVAFTDALSERYLAYALSTITSRSLPDVRDGLKPVHRRLLYAMYQLRLSPDSGFKKCARVVGDVIGKYHPHGDVAVYDAMVRLAQNFAVRYPLVEGQGNFGSIDGDNPAAMRYTEARLTPYAMLLLEGMTEDAIDFRPNYDGSEEEPVLLPAGAPNLLANGAEGIAVGMATSIPPHNLGELCAASLHLLEHPEADTLALMRHVIGPDFPTGGIIIEEPATLQAIYASGKGSIRLRAAWEKEQLSHGLYQIVITEIPYQVQKSRLVEKIADLFKDKKLPLLGNIRDESAEDIRLVLEPKNRSVDAEMLMESLFKVTDLQTRYHYNMNVITSSGAPAVLGLKAMLQEFLDYRQDVLRRRTQFRLDKIAARLEILDGLLIAYLNLDEVIRIIREEDEPKKVMMARWNLTDNQAESILNMRLRSLRKLEEIAIRGEKAELEAERARLELILNDPNTARSAIARELQQVQTNFGLASDKGARRTQFAIAPNIENISIEAFVEREPITVVLSRMGWIKALKGHSDAEDVKFKEGDSVLHHLKTYTTDTIVFFASNGRFFSLTGDKIPGGKGFGEPLRLMMELGNQDEILAMLPRLAEQKLLVASEAGKGFIVDMEQVIASTRAGKQVLNLLPHNVAKLCIPVTGDHLAVIGQNRRMLIFAVSELPEMNKGQGVILQKYNGGGLSDACFINKDTGLSWSAGSRVRTETDITPWLGKRGSVGKLPPVGFPRTNKFA